MMSSSSLINKPNHVKIIVNFGLNMCANGITESAIPYAYCVSVSSNVLSSYSNIDLLRKPTAIDT